MTNLTTASQNSTTAVVSEKGAKGLLGNDGADGSTVSNYVALKNPLASLFKNNVLIDTLSGGLTNTRNTTSTIKSQSGVVQTVGLNESALGEGGVSQFESKTNLILYSEDVSQSSWNKTNTTTAQGLISPDNVSLSKKLIADASTSSHLVTQNTTVSIGHYFASVFVKAGEETTASVHFNQYSPTVVLSKCDIDLLTGELTNATDGCKSERYSGGWWRVSIPTETILTTYQLRVFVRSDSQFLGDGTSGIYIWGGQIVEGYAASPYIKTEGASSTRGGEIISIDSNGNTPAPGDPFTFEFIFDTYLSDDIRTIIRLGSTQQSTLRILLSNNGNISFSMSDGSSVVACSGQASSGFHRYLMSYDGSFMRIFEDGLKISSDVEISNPVYGTSEPIYIGSLSLGGLSLNGQIKDLSIYDFAFTESQAISLGGV